MSWIDSGWTKLASDMDKFCFVFLNEELSSLAALLDPNIYKRLEERLSRILPAWKRLKMNDQNHRIKFKTNDENHS